MNNKQNHMKGRQRGRNGGGKPRPPGRNPNFDSSSHNRPRGNAQQLMEKYLSLARDASSSGDRVLAENYFQHADHYYRVLNARFEQQNGGRRFEGHGGQDRQGYGGDRPHEGDTQPRYGQGDQPQAYQPQVYHPQGHQSGHQGAPSDAQPQGSDAEIGLPPGILGEGPVEAAPEHQDSGEGQGSDFDRNRHGGRRRRGRGDRPFANAAGE